jgi:protein involved in temperature-dependent protein secretion
MLPRKRSKEIQRKLVGRTMDKELFANLVESMQQHNEIIAGTRKPARVTKVDASMSIAQSAIRCAQRSSARSTVTTSHARETRETLGEIVGGAIR